MATTSYIFFGLLLLPLLALIAWMIKQDRKRSYIGIILLIGGMVIAIYSIVRLDRKFTEPNRLAVPKSSNFR